MKPIRIFVLLAATCAATLALAQNVPELSGAAGDPMVDVPAAPLERYITDDVRQMRAYPEQPPIIPHSIEGYQLSVNTNRCLSCHKRENSVGSGAPVISITHYMTRDAQMLADVAPRRYFCTQCHVPQADTDPLVPNTFTDMAELGAKTAGEE